MENNKIYYKYETFKSTTDTTNAIDEVVVTGLYKTFKSTTRTELPPHLSPAILPHSHYDETIGWKLPRNLTQITIRFDASYKSTTHVVNNCLIISLL